MELASTNMKDSVITNLTPARAEAIGLACEMVLKGTIGLTCLRVVRTIFII